MVRCCKECIYMLRIRKDVAKNALYDKNKAVGFIRRKKEISDLLEYEPSSISYGSSYR